MLQAKLIEKSSKKTPDWIGKNFEDKKKLYFSGSSTQSAFDKARQLAINDALTQVTQSLDLTMSVNTQHIISDTGIFLDERTKTKTRAVRLLDTKIKDIRQYLYLDMNDGVRYIFVKENAKLDQLSQLFKRTKQGKTELLIVTKTGDKFEPILGVISPHDILERG